MSPRARSCSNEGLFPGIPDEVTLSLITTKLSFGDCHRLSSVSRAWRHVVRSGEVRDSRICLHSTETLVVLSYRPSELATAIVLYSIRERRCYRLPRFPYLGGRIPAASQCIALEGKIYLVGAPSRVPGSHGVFVLDLVGGMQWKRCANMIEPRLRFGCGVLDGKLFVCGGLGNTRALCGSEVYDPKEDKWSPIRGMTCLRFDHQVASVGDEVLVHGGKVVDPQSWTWTHWTNYHSGRISSDSNLYCIIGYCHCDFSSLLDSSAVSMVCSGATEANSSEVYNVVKDEWSVKDKWQPAVEPVRRLETEVSFVAKGKLHSISSDEIRVRDTEMKSWEHLHSHSFFAKGLVDSNVIVLQTALAVDDRLLTIVEGIDHYGEVKVCRACLLQSRGHGNAKEHIAWERAPFTIYFEDEDIAFTNYSMHPIQL